jgi:TRAP-type C4-dicarboxylate transport system permease small subunit
VPDRLDGGPAVPLRLLGAALALAMFGMMAVTFVDVVGRYLFNMPVPGASELVQLLMATVVAAGLPLVTHARQHVTVDLFSQAFRGQMKLIVDASIIGFSATVLGFVAVLLAQQGQALHSARASSIYLGLPTAPVAWMLAVTTAIACMLEFAALLGMIRHRTATSTP